MLDLDEVSLDCGRAQRAMVLVRDVVTFRDVQAARSVALLLLGTLALQTLTGCAETTLPDSRLRAQAEAYLGQPVLQVLNRRSAAFNNTRYDVRTSRGYYTCLVNGGNALDFGVISAVTCRPT